MTAPTRIALGLAAVIHAAVAHAAEPEIGAYVTDQGEDRFVGLYDDIAVDLAGCTSLAEARYLLQIPSDQPVNQFRRGDLEEGFELGAHPRIPCGRGSSFDIDWPAATPIWADLTGSANYYLPALAGGGVYYAIPTACDPIKGALAIRERIQLPGVLQAIAAPTDLAESIILGCGSAPSAPPLLPPPNSAEWSLHVFDTFLSEESVGDRIYVARLQIGEDEAVRASYLPIWRIDGHAADDVIMGNDPRNGDTEAALRALFDQSADHPITLLGAGAVGPVRSAIFADLCLTDCDGYVYRHAHFAQPAIDPSLTALSDRRATSQINLLGQEQIVWEFAVGRRAVFSGCDRLVDALGVQSGKAAPWSEAVETALDSVDLPAQSFNCISVGTDVCVRKFADGAAITAASLAAGAECAGASRLRIELGATATMPGALSIADTPFSGIEIAPAAGVVRSVVSVVPSLPQAVESSCILPQARGLITVTGAPWLKLSRLDFRRAQGGGPDEVAAVQIERGRLALEDVTIGGEAAGTLPVELGIRLCHGELYAIRSSIMADWALQAFASQVLVTGTESTPTTLAGKRLGAQLAAASTLRMHRAEISAPTSFRLSNAHLKATRSELRSGPGGSEGFALRLERDSRAELTTSIVRGFRCVGMFVDSQTSATIILPANDLAGDNSHISCGTGSVSVLE